MINKKIKPTVALIVAVADNGVIGQSGAHQLLWHQQADLKRFRRLTRGQPMIMGRATFDTFERPLPDRTHIVVTKDPSYRAVAGVVVVHSIDEALRAAEAAIRSARASGAAVRDEIFIIGGAKIFEQTVPLADKIYLTRLHAEPEGDAIFRYDPADWQESEVENYSADGQNDYPYTFVTLIIKIWHWALIL